MGADPTNATDPPSLTQTADGVREAWSIIEQTWRSTWDHAAGLPDAALHEQVDGEWSFVETQRHLLFVTDAWVRRTVLGEPAAYHRLSLPPDFVVGQADPEVDVEPWGIDIRADVSVAEVREVRADHMTLVRELVEGLTPEEMTRLCTQNPAPGFPPVTTVAVGLCLSVVVGEEWAHHSFAVRDLDLLER